MQFVHFLAKMEVDVLPLISAHPIMVGVESTAAYLLARLRVVTDLYALHLKPAIAFLDTKVTVVT